MKGARWIFARAVDARTAGFPNAQAGTLTAGPDVVAEVAERLMSRRQADAFERALSKRAGDLVLSYVTRANPTQVHHQLIATAAWHVLELPRGDAVPLPLADFYALNRKQAGLAAQALADALRVRVMMLDNAGRPPRLADHPARELGPRRTNPAAPVAGEVWTGYDGRRDRIVAVRGKRVQVLHLESGERDWIDLADFVAAHRAPRTRANPAWRFTGTLRTVRPRKARKPRKTRTPRGRRPRLAEVRPAIALPKPPRRRAEFVTGERVSVPYTGRASYFGRKVTKAREHGTVEGYTEQGGQRMVMVRVRRGVSVEDHHFPERHVRRLPGNRYKKAATRVAGLRDRLERQIKGDADRALALLNEAEEAYRQADAVAHQLYPQHGQQPSREYARARAVMRRMRDRMDALAPIVQKLEPAGPDPFAVANRGRRRNPWEDLTGRRFRVMHPCKDSNGVWHQAHDFGTVTLDTGQGESVYAVFDSSPKTAPAAIGRGCLDAGWYQGGRLAADGWVELTRAQWAKIHRDYKGRAESWTDFGKLYGAGTPSMMTRELGGGNALRPVRFVTQRRANPAPRVIGQRSGKGGTVRMKRNPRDHDKAVKTFRMWHEFDPRHIDTVAVHSRQIPKRLVALGRVRRIDYDSDKWEGKPVTYTHDTRRPYPILATDPGATQLYLVGGKMKPTADGLVN